MYKSCTWITTPERIWACVIFFKAIMIYSQVVTLKLPNGLLHQHTQKLLMKVSFVHAGVGIELLLHDE